MKVARWRTRVILIGLLAGIGGCADSAPGSSVIQPSDGSDTTQRNDSGDTPATLPCLLAEPLELQFGGKLCDWTHTQTLTLKACGDTSVTVQEVGLAMDEKGDCIGYNCAVYAVEAASPMTLAPDETTEVLVHYSPPNESTLGSNGQPNFDTATVWVHFDGGQLAVPVSGLAISKPCSAPHMTMFSQSTGAAIADGQTVPVGTTLSFVATPTCDDGPATSWKWHLVAPEGEAATFVPSSTAENPTLTPTYPGKYTVFAEFLGKATYSCSPGSVTFWVGEGP